MENGHSGERVKMGKQMCAGNQEFNLEMPVTYVEKTLGLCKLRDKVRDGDMF